MKKIRLLCSAFSLIILGIRIDINAVFLNLAVNVFLKRQKTLSAKRLVKITQKREKLLTEWQILVENMKTGLDVSSGQEAGE